jgi:hypothetical protein
MNLQVSGLWTVDRPPDAKSQQSVQAFGITSMG